MPCFGFLLVFLFLFFYSLLGIQYTGLSLRPEDWTQFGVDDWSATDVAEFVKNQTRMDLNTNLLAENGIDGQTLFDDIFDDDLFARIGVPSEKNARGKIKASIEKLRLKLSGAPANIWEWRMANRRLCDSWLLPMYSFPTSSLLVWLRYFHVNQTDALAQVRDKIDESTEAAFWSYTVLLPNLPFMKLAFATQMDGLKHYLLRFVAVSALLDNALTLLDAMFTLSLKNIAFREIFGVAFSWLVYLAWPFVPRFIEDILFFETLFVFHPIWALLIIRCLILTLQNFGRGNRKIERIALRGFVTAAQTLSDMDAHSHKE